MNELKFRIWHKEFKKFLPKNDEWFLGLDGNLLFYDVGGAVFVSVNKDYYIIQKFTGLVDKNGKEICEGDILFWEEQNVIVEWNYRLLLNIQNYDKNHIEIVGNIFENPEPLK